MRLESLTVAFSHRTCAGCAVCVEAPGFCLGCAELLLPMPHGVGAFAYGGPLRDALQRYKYRGAAHLSAPLGALFAQHLGPVSLPVHCVVPVPATARVVRARGYHPAALLAAELARRCGFPCDVHAVRKTRETPAQVGLLPRDRLHNLRGAFAVRSDRARARLQGARVLLVDDVCTTGATLDAVEAALRLAGASAVLRRTLAIVAELPPTSHRLTRERGHEAIASATPLMSSDRDRA